MNHSNFSISEINSRLQVAKLAVAKGGEELLRFYKDNKITSNKEGSNNFVTQADLNSNNIIISIISNSYPKDSILTEETESQIKDVSDERGLWVIDPLDGTYGFRYGRKYAAVSVGFVSFGEPLFGAIFDPFQNDIYWSYKGGGSWCNDQKIKVREIENINDFTIATGNGYDQRGRRRNIETLLKFDPLPWLTIKDSIVLMYCEVAKGAIDLVFGEGVKPWDNAAGKLLIEEAGGGFYDFNKVKASFTTPSVIAGNLKLIQNFSEKITLNE